MSPSYDQGLSPVPLRTCENIVHGCISRNQLLTLRVTSGADNLARKAAALLAVWLTLLLGIVLFFLWPRGLYWIIYVALCPAFPSDFNFF